MKHPAPSCCRFGKQLGLIRHNMSFWGLATGDWRRGKDSQSLIPNPQSLKLTIFISTNLLKRQLAILGVISAGLAGLTTAAYAGQRLPVPVVPNLPPPPPEPTLDVEPLPPTAEAWRNPQLVRTLKGHSAPVDALTFSPDGQC